MTEEEMSEYILTNKRWPFRFSDIYNFYFILFFPALLIIVALAALSSGIKNEVISLILMPSVLILIAILAIIYSLRRIKKESYFSQISVETIPSDILSAKIKQSIINLRWKIKAENNGFIIAESNWNLQSWGERITIVYGKGEILINSRPVSPQPFTFNRDEVNKEKLINELS